MELKLNRNGIKTEQKKKWKKGKEWKQKEVEAESKVMNSWEKETPQSCQRQPGPGNITAERQLYMEGSAKENPHQILCKVPIR